MAKTNVNKTKPRRLTYEMVVERVAGVGCEFLSDSFSGRKRIYKFRCCCGDTFDKTWIAFEYTPKCKKCSTKNKSLSYEYVVDYVKKNGKGTILLSSEYENVHKDMFFKCGCCGDTYVTTFHCFKSEKKITCTKCGRKRIADKTRLTTKDILQFLNDNNYTCVLQDEYCDYSTPMKLLCACGNEFYSHFHSLRESFGRCKQCRYESMGNKQRLSQKEASCKVRDELGDSYVLMSNYESSKGKIKVKHIECGNSYNTWFKKISTCPFCFASKGESKIREYITKNGFSYIAQKSFDGLCGVNGGLLSYDFYLPNQNLLIEFQGEQHESPVSLFGGDEQFKVQQIHDKKKLKYAIEHNFKLLVIWHYEYDRVEDILNNALLVNEGVVRLVV